MIQMLFFAIDLLAWAFMPFRLLLILFLAPSLFAGPLSDRYLPNVEDAELLQQLSVMSLAESARSWRTADELRKQRVQSDDELPLSGLRLAIDPGHLGGIWAEHEGRNFRIEEDDFWVREGELVLEVAQRAQNQLSKLGADIVLLREDSEPVNPRRPEDYIPAVIEEMGPMQNHSLIGMTDYAIELRRRIVRRSIISGELAARSRKVNDEIKPDALISLHINAARWPVRDDEERMELVEGNHLHLLIFGCMSVGEIAKPWQRKQLEVKLANGSGPEELALASALAESLADATGLPASEYEGSNAIRPLEDQPYVWARNLMLLRQVECPVVLLEPYVANSEQAYPRLQSALKNRADGTELADDDILIEYADAVVEGVLRAYGQGKGR